MFDDPMSRIRARYGVSGDDREDEEQENQGGATGTPSTRRVTPPALPASRPGVSSPSGNAALARLHSHYSNSQVGDEGGLQPATEVGGFRDAAGRVLQTVNRWVKPIFLPQELLFSTLAGAVDEESTIFERLQSVEWRQFIPGSTEMPELTSGRELLELFGVQDENALKWGGIATELFVDPLLAGSAMRVAGRGLRSAELVRLGDKFDEVSSIGGLYRSSGPVKDFVDRRVEAVLTVLRDPERSILGLSTERALRGVDALFTRTTAARVRLGGVTAAEREAGRRQLEASGRYADTVGTGDIGRDVVIARQLGTQRAKEVYEEAYDRLVAAQDTLFGEPKTLMRRLGESLSHGVRAEEHLPPMNQRTRDTLLKWSYDFVDGNSFLFNTGVREADDAARVLVGQQRVVESQRSFAELQERVRKLALDEGLNEQAAENLVSRFSKFTQQVAEADAMLGFHLSGYEHVQKKFMQQVMFALGDQADTGIAQEVWVEFMRRAAREETGDALALNFDDMLSTVLGRRRGNVPVDARRQVAVGKVSSEGERVMYLPERAGESTAGGMTGIHPGRRIEGDTATPRSVRDVLEGEDLFSSLNITSYIKGLATGHMRRAYGMFVDDGNFNSYIRSLKEGKIIPSNILDEVDLQRVLSEEGFAEEAASIERYLNALRGTSSEGTSTARQTSVNAPDTPRLAGPTTQGRAAGVGTDGTPRGFVINKHNLTQAIVDDLVKNGASKQEAAQRARNAMLRVIESMNPEGAPVYRRMQEAAERFERNLSGARHAASKYSAQQQYRPGTFGRQFFDARDDLDQETLEMLGEFMNPLVSLQETISASRVRMPAQEFMRRTYRLAEEYGMISDREIVKNGVTFRRVAEGPEIYGAFSGKYIHPGLREEIQRVITSRGTHAQALQRMRSLISGGYLASPNVVVTNTVGGIFTAALAGIAPGRMLRAMAETLRPLLKNGGREYDVYNDLTKHIGVQETSAVTQNVAAGFERLRLHETGMEPSAVRQGLQKFTEWFEDRLRQPLGEATWWAGLDGFQFAEKWLKTAAFKAERDRLIARYGSDATGFARATKEAAELARISVFDYSELPDLLKWARDYGVIMFPGFTYFQSARFVNSILNKPGQFGAWDRLSEAITSANLDPEDKMLFYHSMPDWLKEDQGTVIGSYEGPEGETRAVAIPLNQMIPTNTQYGGPFAESLGTGGIYRPFLEMLTAFTFADGEAVFSRSYGSEVYSPDARGIEKFTQAGAFLYNSLAPSAVRKLIRPGETDPEGIVPAVYRSVVPVNEELANNMYSFREVRRGVPDRRVEEEVISTFIRSTQTIGLGGSLNGIQKQLDRERMVLQQEIGALRQRFMQARYEGREEDAERLQAQVLERRTEFLEKWQPLIELYRERRSRQQQAN